MASEKLVISLLGPLEIKVGNKLLHINRKMFRYFLIYLACQAEPISRESICEIFWPQEDETVSRKNLREVVSKLRRELPIDDLILTEKEYVSFNKSRVEVDFLRFDEITALIRKNLDETTSGKISDPVYMAVQNALGLWRADHFLGGVSTTGSASFQQWVNETAGSLQYWRQMMTEWLADRCIVLGNYKEALTWLSLARKFDKINTEINVLTLTCLRDLNLWSEALHFCSLLESDYPAGGEKEIPAPLRDLIERVRSESKQLRKSGPITWNDNEGRKGNFIGRKNYLTEMNHVLSRGGIMLILGERGSGKTKLLNEFYEHMEIAPRLLFYAADAGDENFPYRALVQCFRKIISAEEWQALEPVYALILLPLFPEMVSLRQDLSLEKFISVDLDERLIPDAFVKVFSLLNPRQKNLLIIDNAQWLDKESLDTLAYLKGLPGAAQSGTIIFAARTDQYNPNLMRFIDREFPAQIVKILHLDPLHEDEVRELIFQDFHQVCPESLAEQLIRSSGGNPLYLSLIIENLKNNKFNVADPLESQQLLTEPLVQAIEQNLRNLDDIGQRVITNLSVLDNHFSPNLVEHMTGLHGDELTAALRDLTSHNLLEVVNSADGHSEYHFSQEIVADRLRHSIGPAEKVQLHQKAARVIAQYEGDGDAQAARLAYQYQSAGELLEALSYWIIAGSFEKENHQISKANEYFKKAFDLVSQLGGSAKPDAIYKLATEWGDLALQLDDIPTFSSINSTCLRFGESRNDQRLIGLGKSGLGWVAHFRGYYDIGIGLLTQAVQIFQRENDSLDLMDAYLRLGTIYFINQDFNKSIEMFDKLLAVSLSLQSTQAMSFYKKASAFVVYAYCVVGQLNVAKGIADKGLAIAQTLGETNYTVQLKASEAIIHYYDGDLDVARQRFDSILPEVRALNMDWWWYAIQMVNSQAALENGDIAACWKISQMLSDFSSPVVLPGWGESFGNYLKGEIFIQLNDLERAEEHYRKNLENPIDELNQLISKLGLVKVNIKRMLLQDCKAELEMIVRKADSHGFELISQGAKLEILNLEISRNEKASLKRVLRAHSNLLANSEFTGIRSMYSVLEGNALVKLGDLEKGRQKLFQAFESTSEHHYYWVHLAALKGLIICGGNSESQLKTGKKLLEKAVFQCEAPELQDSLRRFAILWPNQY